MSCHALLQVIFPTQGLNQGLQELHANSLPSKTPEKLAMLGDVKNLEMVSSQSSLLSCIFSATIVLYLPLCLLLKTQLIGFSIWTPLSPVFPTEPQQHSFTLTLH